MKKRFMSLALATLMVFAMMTSTAFAASDSDTAPEISSIAATLGTSYSKTVNIGLALDPGDSGWSQIESTYFSATTSAVVDTITIAPGTATINSGNKNLLGAVLPSLLKITAPDGTTVDIPWNSKGMTTTAFKGVDARGTWSLRLYGTNLTKPTGDYMSDLLRFGSISYKNLKMTINCE